ncbi:MAG: class I SAM-dependent methyltransferase [Myxococcales bacterium]|nr:class I SAM-dependent methyltransferase [Myxococcales bacterium]MDD9966636.1 class I SAM-dependent methyltransferase [Myxococcales bacterium]
MEAFSYVGDELELFREAHNWKRYLKRTLAPLIRGHVLEVGAGLGGTTIALHDSACQSWTCLEPDPEAHTELTSAVSELRDREGRAPRTVVGDLASLGPEARYDTVLYVDVLEHIEDDRGELARAAQHLLPGGHVIVMSPAHPWLYSEFDRAIGHYRRYTLSSLVACSPPSVQVVCRRYLDSIGVVASLGNRLLLRRSMPEARHIEMWDRLMIPVSRVTDPLLGYRLGKSVLVAWQA